jgi:hypothetical protein
MSERDALKTWVARAHLLVPGGYAWLATVAAPAAARGAPVIARASAMLALIALIAGPYLALARPRLGRAVGVVGFVALCMLTWLLLGSFVDIDRLEPFQAALGGLGWVAFAFGWGTLRNLGSVPEEHPNVLEGAPLTARGELPRGALVVVTVSVLGALLCLTLAWRVERVEHALLAHGCAIGCAIALLTNGAKLAIVRSANTVERAPNRRFAAASRSLAGLMLLLATGAVWALLVALLLWLTPEKPNML